MVDGQFSDTHRRGDDVDDGIGGADFMKMNIDRRRRRGSSLRLGRAGRRSSMAVALTGAIQFTALEQSADLLARSAAALVAGRSLGTGWRGRRGRVFFAVLSANFSVGIFLSSDFELAQRQAEIDQRGDEHVAADAADEVSVGYFHFTVAFTSNQVADGGSKIGMAILDPPFSILDRL